MVVVGYTPYHLCAISHFAKTGCDMRAVVASKPNSIKCEIPFNQKLDVKSDFPRPILQVHCVRCKTKASCQSSLGLARGKYYLEPFVPTAVPLCLKHNALMQIERGSLDAPCSRLLTMRGSCTPNSPIPIPVPVPQSQSQNLVASTRRYPNLIAILATGSGSTKYGLVPESLVALLEASKQLTFLRHSSSSFQVHFNYLTTFN